MEWYPAPSNTSATFLNQVGGLGFGVRDEEQVEGKDADDRKSFKLYLLSAASEEEESDSSQRERKGRDREESRTKKTKSSLSRSPDREKIRSRSRERRNRSRDGDRKKDRRSSDSKRRSSLDENSKRKLSCSSGELEYSGRKSSYRPEHSGNSASKHPENRNDSSSRNLFEENRGRLEVHGADQVKREKESRMEEGTMPDQGHSKKGSAGNQNEQCSMGAKKDLPANLLDIFNQIAQFEKEKGVKPKK